MIQKYFILFLLSTITLLAVNSFQKNSEKSSTLDYQNHIKKDKLEIEDILKKDLD